MSISKSNKIALFILGLSLKEIAIINKISDEKILEDSEKKIFQSIYTKYEKYRMKPIFELLEKILDHE